ncbi:mgpp2cl-1, protein phosphatase 2C-like protein 1 [Microbotryomycetes sp. JL201]|nr:mgpp2cl-1, protein phosphatase 2C-like protein 1 [Microbotryomycetes sp. JL201]
MSRIEQISVTLPAQSRSRGTMVRIAGAVASAVPWWLWLVLAATAYLYINKWWNKPLPGQLRRRTGKAQSSAPHGQRQKLSSLSTTLASVSQSPSRSPQISRKNGQAWGPRHEQARYRSGSSVSTVPPTYESPGAQHAFSTGTYQGSPRSGSSGAQSRHQKPFANSFDALPSSARYQSPNVPAMRSKLKREFVPSPSPDRGVDDSTKRRRASDVKAHDQGDGDDDDQPMELDELQAHATETLARRGRKRGRVREEDVGAKRQKNIDSSRQEGPYATKKHLRDSDDEATIATEDDSSKRRRSNTAREKRPFRDVDEDDGQFEYDEDFHIEAPRHRNADSDVDEENVSASEVETDEPRHKRTRSVSVRSASEEESVMGDDLDLSPSLSSSFARNPERVEPTPKKRSLKPTTQKAVKSLSSKRNYRDSPGPSQRRPGDEWTNMEGDRCRMDNDGHVRKLCEVREMRRKHKMPADSVHPDAKVMHEVIVEKWLTDAEQDELAKQRKLAWQTPFEHEKQEAAQSATTLVDPPSEKKEKPAGFYYSSGTGTPLRTHSALAQRQVSTSRPNSRQGSPAAAGLPRSGSNSPALVNGRMRIASGAQSPARSWSFARIAKLAEDEQRAKAEREKRRKASIMLGGEQEQAAVENKADTKATTAEAGAESEPETKQHDKLKLQDYGADGKKLDTSLQPTTSVSAGVESKEATKAPFSNLFSGLDRSKDAAVAPASSLFSFGKPASTEAKDATVSAKPETPQTFSLGSNSASAQPAVTESKHTFSFGGSSAPSKTDGTPSAPANRSTNAAPNLSFGGNVSAAADMKDKAQTSTPSFSFGAPKVEDSEGAPSPHPPSGAATPFSGTAAPSPAATAPSFSFGSTQAAPAQPPKAETPSLSFGSNSLATAAPSFSFGAPTSSAPKPAAAAAPSFSFGASAPTNTSTNASGPSVSGFSFGHSAPTGASAPTFSFGTNAKTNAPAPSAPFSFGATAAPGTGAVPGAAVAPAMFALGSSGGNESDSLDLSAIKDSPPPPMSDPNAKTRQETLAKGADTFGCLNQHPQPTNHETTFKVGVSVDRNKKCRRTMEDAHSFIYDFGGIRGQGYFAIFDGHAGKHAAEWCGEHFHEHLLEGLRTAPATPVPDLLNSTFHVVDTKLSELASSEGTHSGCTAAVVFLRLEDEDGNPVGEASGVGKAVETKTGKIQGEPDGALKAAQAGEGTELQRVNGRLQGGDADASNVDGASSLLGSSSGSTSTDIKNKIRAVLSGGKSSAVDSPSSSSPEEQQQEQKQQPESLGTSVHSVVSPDVQIKGPAEVRTAAKRTLYTANVGDARAVLSRGGRAVRLTYDHKGSDAKEAKRITDAGGFVMNNRVNGVLAVTRSLGDSSMKEFVVGSPYTTETAIGPGDDFLIVACDGLWDVCQDQEAVDLIKDVKDPQEASQVLLDHALNNFSADNLSVLVVALSHEEAAPAVSA